VFRFRRIDTHSLFSKKIFILSPICSLFKIGVIKILSTINFSINVCNLSIDIFQTNHVQYVYETFISYILDSISCMNLLLIIKIHKTINKQPLYIHLRNKCGITKNKPRMSIHMYIWRCYRKYFVMSKFQLFKTGINTTPETEYFNRPCFHLTAKFKTLLNYAV
jgi:hypothetical protein